MIRKSMLLISLLTVFIEIGPSYARDVSFERDTTLPIVNINFALKAGAVNDPKGESGLTNFMGEMLLRGTATRSKEQIDRALDQMGAKLDVETRAEALIFRGAVLSSKLTDYLNLLEEIFTQPAFPEKEIKKLKGEVISTIQEELGHDPSLASRKFSQFLFQGHPYGNPITGKIADIESLKREQIVTQYHRLFQDPLMIVLGSGDADPEVFQKWGEKIAKAHPAQKDGNVGKTPPPQPSEKRRFQLVDKPDRTQTQIDIGQIGVRMDDPGFFPLYLGNHAFGGHSFSAVLMQEIRVKRGWSYGAGSNFRFGIQPRSWHLHLFPAAKDTPQALALSLNLVKDLQEKGITQAQYEFSKQSLINSSGFMFNTPKKRIENALLEKTLDLPEGYMRSYAKNLTKTDFKEVNTAFKKFLKPENLTISILGTSKTLKKELSKAIQFPENEIEVKHYTE